MESCFYFDGSTAQGYECSIYIDQNNVYIYFENQPEQNIIWNKSGITYFDISGNHLSIKYGPFPQKTIEYTGLNSSTLYQQLSKGNLSKQSKSIWLNNKLTIAISLCVGFILICCISYFYLLPWVGEKAVVLIPQNVEVEIGNSIAESVLISATEKDSASNYANLFVSKLQTNSTYSIQIKVIDSEEINAFALPGGKIFIYSEIIKQMSSYEEFTALLGHEISHVTNQHSLKSICRTAASSIFIALLFGDVAGISSAVVEQADAFKQLHYSRELETQADDKGLEFMIQNKVSPKGMINLLTLLKLKSKDMPDFMKYISTHPETDERIKNIKSKKESTITYEEDGNLKSLFEKIKLHLK
ncbi:MAG: M48 family metallopeptidase [Bacteroidota bacterium]